MNRKPLNLYWDRAFSKPRALYWVGVFDKAEVCGMFMTEFDEVLYNKTIREEAREAGLAEGRMEGRMEEKNKLKKLSEKLECEGRSSELLKAIDDTYMEKLCKEFDI